MAIKKLVNLQAALLATAVLLAAVLFAALGTLSALADEKPPEPVTVNKVLSAKLEPRSGELTVRAVGEVPTAGFTKPTLTRVTYIKPPDDGIQDYTFQAVPPSGIVAQVVSRVEASDIWKSPPAWVKGVRIRGVGDGVLVKMLGET
jgi:hypothetical protein